MKKRVAGMWVRALRSGNYKQGFDQLKVCNEDGSAAHCCLGVLCELYNKSMKRQGKRRLSRSFMEVEFTSRQIETFDGEDQVLPKKVLNWAGMDDDSGMFYTRDGSKSLARMNDEGRTFRQIAQVIEKNVERL